MEPEDIDWSTVVSRYVRDDAYEGIEAPRWADLSAPNAGAGVDDDAWFCRADCRHPKTAEDFLKLTPSPKSKLLRSTSAVLPFGEKNTNTNNLRDGNNNLKRRGGGGIAAFMSPKPKATAKKRFQDDSENQDPELATPPPRPAASRPPFGAPRWAKNAKEAIKSSAERRLDIAEKEALLSNNAKPRQLKSTLSARNLFSGRDILGQISEFYNELKRMAGGGGGGSGGGGGRGASEAPAEQSPSPTKESSGTAEAGKIASSGSGGAPSEAAKEAAKHESVEQSASPRKPRKMVVRVETGKERSLSVLKEVKATPPTPQRFLSPLANEAKNVRATATATATATAGSPLRKPLKVTPERGTPNKDLENSRDNNTKRQPFAMKDMNNTRACDAEGSSSSMFWFLKPCTYLVE